MRAGVQIRQLTGIKVFALLGIFYWHVWPHADSPDVGARLVELFFVISGFLVGLRNHGAFEVSASGCWGYVWPKIRKLYPVYLVGLSLGVLSVALRGSFQFGADTILPIVWALGLQQAWIPAAAMVYNGASWFISAWAFCMLCAPLLQWLLDVAQDTLGAAQGLVVYFVVTLAVRVFLEMCHLCSPGVYAYSLHSNPFVRLLEFSLAYAVGVWFRDRAGRGLSFGVSSLIEVGVVVVAASCVIGLDTVWPRWAFVLVWVAFVPILARGGGLLSWLLSRRPIVMCGKIEMEFFLLHNAIIGVVTALFFIFDLGGYKRAALISFLATIALALICRWLFRSSNPGVSFRRKFGSESSGR